MDAKEVDLDEFVQFTAEYYAQWAHEETFERRRGVVAHDEFPGFVILFDNSPYANEPDRRNHELQELEARLRSRGIVVAARASYPTSGPDVGYSIAMVLDVSVATDGTDVVRDAWLAVVTDRRRLTKTGRRLSPLN